MKLRAIIHPDESGGFWAEVPALPGCMTQGETLAEVQANTGEAIEAWLEGYKSSVRISGIPANRASSCSQ